MSTKRKPIAKRKGNLDRNLRDALERADRLIERRRWPEAHALLNDLCRTYPQRPVILRRLVSVAAARNDAHTYQYCCEALSVLCPRDPDLPHMLVLAYVKNGFLALAWEMGARALSASPGNEQAAATRRILAGLETVLPKQAAALGLDGADDMECLALHDRARSYLAMAHFAMAREAAEHLMKRRPRFAPAYNNAAEACFHDAALTQAIDMVQRLLASDTDNVFALANLVRFLCASGKADEARRHADRLAGLRAAGKSHAIKQAEALTWLGDDAAVLAVFERGQRLPAEDGPTDDAHLCHLAAVAAYRLGHEDQARSYWHAALQAVPSFELARENLNDLGLPVGDRNAPWSYSLTYFVPRKLLEELVKRVAQVFGKDHDALVRRETDRYLEAHPELEGLVPLLLDRSDRAGRELALRLVTWFRTPVMLRAVRDFALGRRGSDKLRMQAAHLAETEGLLPSGPAPLWVSGESRPIALARYEIHGEPTKRVHAPGVADLVSQGADALRAGNSREAERLLARALALDPDDPVVMNNLAQVYDSLGRTPEAEALTIRLHERHPDYLFGRIALASLAAERRQLDRARELLGPLLERKRFHFSEFAALCMAQINLLLADGKQAAAQSWLDTLRQTMPDHPSLGWLGKRVREQA